jgi:hypothetical protein
MSVVVQEPGRHAGGPAGRRRGLVRGWFLRRMSKLRKRLQAAAEFAYELLTGPF